MINRFPKGKATLTADGDYLQVQLSPWKYDVIQIDVVPTGTPGAGDLLAVSGIDEDGDTIPLPGSPYSLTSDKSRQFTWHGAQIKCTYTEAGGGTTQIVVKVKLLIEHQNAVDSVTAYTALTKNTANQRLVVA